MYIGSLRRIVESVKNSCEAVWKTTKEQPHKIAWIFMLVCVATWCTNNWTISNTNAYKDVSVESEFSKDIDIEETMTTATVTTATTSTTTKLTTTTTMCTTTTECTTTMCTTTEVSTELIVETEENIQVEVIQVEAIKIESDKAIETVEASESVEDSTEYAGVGQYGYAIDPVEYVYLAQVIEHEGGNCSLVVKEHIGICLLNKTFAPGFKNSVYGNKEAPGQYFSGWYNYTEESADIAKNLISAYNSGAEYWSQFCVDRNLTWDTVFQRNDYAVPGTQEVYRETATTSGGYKFTMVYSRRAN